MNDIRPPRRPGSNFSPPRPSQPPPGQPVATESQPSLPPIEPDVQLTVRKRRSWKKWLLSGAAALFVLIIAVGAASALWYQQQLQPVAAHAEQKIRVVIETGMGPDAIAAKLADADLVKSELAFDWYVRLSHVSNQLQAGTYTLSQAMSVEEIVSHLTSGKTDNFSITFLPGATVAENKTVFRKAGYKQADIDAAFAKQYDHSVFQTKPADADLEGYVYGETYNFPADTSIESILERTFDELYTVIQKNDLITRYKSQGLSLYEGISLASMIQREVSSTDSSTPSPDQKQVAQVFLLRLKKDIPLGSDVTYQYAADKAGVARDPALESPYNTRVVKGLPPGPIAAPGAGALIAAATPAKGDYLYFLSGDDDTTYFAHTEEQHQKNIEQHCQEKCQIL